MGTSTEHHLSNPEESTSVGTDISRKSFLVGTAKAVAGAAAATAAVGR